MTVLVVRACRCPGPARGAPVTVYGYSLPYLLVAGYPLLVAGHVLAAGLHAARSRP